MSVNVSLSLSSISSMAIEVLEVKQGIGLNTLKTGKMFSDFKSVIVSNHITVIVYH